MGCDVHAYIEFSECKDDPLWESFTRDGGRRDYLMFGIMAGVRVPSECVFDPRGVPSDMGYITSSDYYLNVAPKGAAEYADWEGWCAFENAIYWVDSGLSVDPSGDMKRISNPDYHSGSWMTADELERAIDRYRQVSKRYFSSFREPSHEWYAMLSAMREFETRGCLSRLVFWFDN